MAVDRLGALRSKVELTLHTHHAARIWKGRGVETGRPQIIGMRQFLLICGAIKQNAAKDDPYADHWLLQLDDKLADTRTQLDQRLQELDSLMAQLPPELNVEENLNQQPLKLPVYTGGQHGWLALRLLIDFDRFVRRVMLAHHIALIGRRQMEEYVRLGGHLLRSLCASTQKYPGFSGATRDDFAANNAKARDAIEKFGVLPDDVLSGKRRSEFAPPIARTAEARAPTSEDGPKGTPPASAEE
ncbi:PFL_4669 family integrating conjugative element protein [Halomonas halodenitrificans]|uniref:PFL_4669 family integrating conjugative element protein n=1 Tax=Halomonas halodenitrificans TaxID=28252 RepID=UPI000687A71C|nr:TIGR03761 family integrating conjugative element protein [Halomonas halodenitrificans]